MTKAGEINNKPIGYVALLLAALVLTSCGSDTTGSSDRPKAAGGSSTPSPTKSGPPEPPPSGTLATTPLPCKKFAPAGFQQAGAGPDVMCAFESSDGYLSVTVGAGPRSFEGLQRNEEFVAKSKGLTPRTLQRVIVPGWTFAAIFPEMGGFSRIELYLVDSARKFLLCKVGVEGRKVDVSDQAGFCEAVRAALYKP